MPKWLWESPSRTRQLFVLSFSLVAFSVQASVEISPEYVFENFSKRSLRLENLQLRARSAEAQLGALQGLYDPEFGLSLGSEISRAESLSGLNNLEDRSQIFGSFLRKTFATGTSLELQYALTRQNSILNPFTSSLRSSSVTENRVTVLAKQNLVYNALGGSQRLRIEAAERNDEAQKLLATEQSEELLLQNLAQFWETYKAHERLQLALEARKTYEDLLGSTRENRRLGLADSGDLARAEAGLEAQQQKVKAASAMYLSSIEVFFDLMDESIPEGQDPTFRIPNEIPAIPSSTQVAAPDLRLNKISDMQLEALDAERAAYKLEDLPVLNLDFSDPTNAIDTLIGE
jgi:outer membrane protein TolC